MINKKEILLAEFETHTNCYSSMITVESDEWRVKMRISAVVSTTTTLNRRMESKNSCTKCQFFLLNQNSLNTGKYELFIWDFGRREKKLLNTGFH
jgi:hypothetical protein